MEVIMRLLNATTRLTQLKRCASVLLLASPQWVLAHGDFLYMPQVKLDGGIYLSTQNKGPSDSRLWHIPGVLMGGEAAGSEQGFTVNDANLSFVWANQAGLFAVVDAAAHGHVSDLEPKLEQAFSGYHWTHTSGHVKLEAGKMKGAFSLKNPLHPSDRIFTEASLPYQAFLGDHFSDAGARAQFMNWHGEQGLSTYGVEIWRGHSYPANKSADTPAWDVFARYQHTAGRLQVIGGGWYFRSKAEQRRDDRAEHGHSHGAITSNADARFTGETHILGLEAKALWQQTPVLSYTVQGELMLHNSDGTLRDDTRQADADLDQQGASIAFGSQYLNHQLAVRYSALKTDNTLSGAGSTILGDGAGLNANNHRPERLTFSYQYNWTSGVALRGELVRDSSSSESLDYARLSVSWDGTLWEK